MRCCNIREVIAQTEEKQRFLLYLLSRQEKRFDSRWLQTMKCRHLRMQAAAAVIRDGASMGKHERFGYFPYLSALLS